MSDYVVIEMGSCLSRFTAGLVYILYRCFREVGNEMKYFLVFLLLEEIFISEETLLYEQTLWLSG